MTHRQTSAWKKTRHRTGKTRATSPGMPSAGPSAGPSPRDPEVLGQLAGEVAIRTFPASQRDQWRRQIYEQMLLTSRCIDGPNFQKVSPEDVSRMIRLYDDRFFDGKILSAASAEGITFHLSSRMTSVGGKLVTQYPEGNYDGRRNFELVLSSTLLFQTFEDVSRPIEVAGCVCRDRLEAMQRIAEHEFVHLVEMLIWNDGNCSEARYQSIANRYFGHTDYQHNLITQRERAAVRFNIRVGDDVFFFHEGHRMQGRVNRITRRATVLVPNAAGQKFNDGKRYSRYYVPLERLRRVK
ncbi:hypothetical protein Enr13x_13370 [Stieleria neptunia]|uniref:SprT-like family protein n=1 Tax=Stieleria neptunia TaxID=2527979 RepID=A0A518HKW8_9BACT|nr:hypothetical protein [Stieleria neptunia]QDV41494.1 hypothetical protein Enr13x_13370 [Stieleria neptunia]